MSHDLTRRSFLCAVAGCAAAAAGGCGDFTHTAFFQKNFRDMTEEEKRETIARLEREAKEEFGKEVTIGKEGPMEGVQFAYALDLSRCIGCRRCVYACVEENNQSREPQIHWIRVLEMQTDHGVDFAYANPYYDPEQVPEAGRFYVPMACQQCENPPCVKACPTGATWREDDGIVAIDYDWCIGCRCCMSACPYGARHFNWAEPTIEAEEVNPDMHYLGNRIRPKGVVEKCTFCIHRVRDGRYPACVEICPVGARKFGNLLDEESEIRYLMHQKRVFVLKEDLNTQPKFYYFYAT